MNPSLLSWPGQNKPPLGTPLNRAYPLANGLVFCPLLSEGAGADITDNLGNTGSLIGAVSWASGRSGSSLNFPGSPARGLVAYNPAFNTQIISVFCWVKTTSSSSQNIVDRDGESSDRIFQFRLENTGVVGFILITPTVRSFTGVVPVNDGKWHFIGVVYDGAKCRLYVDGLLDAVAAMTGAVGLSTALGLNLGVNGSPGALFQYFTGQMDAPRFYNRALTASEIGSLYAAPYQMFASVPSRFYSVPSGVIKYVPYHLFSRTLGDI